MLAVGAAAATLVGTTPAPTSEALWRVSSSEIGNLLARWDTQWYYSIATTGYHWDPSVFRHENVVFFPLYPMLMRFGGQVLGGHPLAAGLIVSLASFTAAMAILYRLAAEELGDEYAGPVVLLISTYPFALFFSAVYTEALFLLLTVSAFYAMRRERALLVAVAGLAAGLARPNGFWLAVPLLWMAIERRTRTTDSAPRPMLAAAALAPLVGVAMYSAYLFAAFGDALAWVHGQAAWGVPLALRFGAADSGPFERAFTVKATDVLMWTLNIGVFVVVLKAIRPIARRFGMPYVLWIALTLVPPLLTHLFMSMGRFTSVLFPLFFWLATIVPREKLWKVAVGCAAVQLVFAILFFLWRPVV